MSSGEVGGGRKWAWLKKGTGRDDELRIEVGGGWDEGGLGREEGRGKGRGSIGRSPPIPCENNERVLWDYRSVIQSRVHTIHANVMTTVYLAIQALGIDVFWRGYKTN